ncbi:MAG: OprD family outer membrane porin [Burkholderiales bacterium]
METKLARDALSALAAAAVAGIACAQGIMPGDLPKEGYRLPGGIEPVLQLRTYYFDQESTSGAPSKAWALGGWVGARSPWWGDVFQAAVNFYTSQRLYGPEGEGGTKLLQSNQAAINVLGEAFGAVRVAGQTFTGYRQLINRPFVNPQDNRMVPNTFEAYTLSGAFDKVSYIGGYVTKEKVRDTESFRWMSNVAGGSGNQEGLAFAGGTYTFGKGGYVRLDEQYAFDTFNTFYADVRYPIAVDDRTTITLGAQYYPQTSVGDEQIGSFSTYGYGLHGGVAYGPVGVQLYWTQTGTGRDTLNPFGSHASYLDLMQVSFNTAGEKAWGVGANVDFADVGAPGLTAAAIYASGSDRIDYTTGAPMPDHNETDVRIDYAFAKGSVLEGFSATFRYSWLNQDGAAQTGTQLRAYVNYAVKF